MDKANLFGQIELKKAEYEKAQQFCNKFKNSAPLEGQIPVGYLLEEMKTAYDKYNQSFDEYIELCTLRSDKFGLAMNLFWH